MTDESYRRLADHLDRLPGGFATSDPEVALRLLKRLFSPLEAELATSLTLEREDAGTIARRAGIPQVEAEGRLAEMAHRGLIFSVHPGEGPPLYQAVPFVVGIYEFQVNNLDGDLVRELTRYWLSRRPQPEIVRQMRTIPVGRSIEPAVAALPYDRVDDLIAAHDRFAVAPCICRREAAIRGRACAAPEESCLVFGDWADFYVRDGRARPIDRSEVAEILARADAANLVLQPSNSREVSFICCCCGCCCGVLRGLRMHPRPADLVVSSFVASLEPGLCSGCGACLERCQMQALVEEDGRCRLEAGRCIGCGLCVTTCPTGALRLKSREDRRHADVPEDMEATWRAIALDRETGPGAAGRPSEPV